MAEDEPVDDEPDEELDEEEDEAEETNKPKQASRIWALCGRARGSKQHEELARTVDPARRKRLWEFSVNVNNFQYVGKDSSVRAFFAVSMGPSKPSRTKVVQLLTQYSPLFHMEKGKALVLERPKIFYERKAFKASPVELAKLELKVAMWKASRWTFNTYYGVGCRTLEYILSREPNTSIRLQEALTAADREDKRKHKRPISDVGVVLGEVILEEVFDVHLFFENWKLYPRAQERTKDDKMLTFVVPKNCFANPAKNKNCQAVHTSWREQGSSLEPFFWKSTSHAAKMRGTRRAVQQMYFIVKLFSGKRGVGDKHPLAKFVASSVFNFQSVLDIPFFKGMMKRLSHDLARFTVGALEGSVACVFFPVGEKTPSLTELYQPRTSSSVGHLHSSEIHLVIRIQKCEGLAIADEDKGVSSPFLRVSWDNMMQTSAILKDTLRPVFNHTFYFPVRFFNDKVTARKYWETAFLYEMKSKGDIQIQLWHYDEASSTSLGFTTASLISVLRSNTVVNCTLRGRAESAKQSEEEELDVQPKESSWYDVERPVVWYDGFRTPLVGCQIANPQQALVHYEAYFYPAWPVDFKHMNEHMDDHAGELDWQAKDAEFLKRNEAFAEYFAGPFPDSIGAKRCKAIGPGPSEVRSFPCTGAHPMNLETLPLMAFLSEVIVSQDYIKPAKLLHWMNCITFRMSVKQERTGRITQDMWKDPQFLLFSRQGTPQDHAILLCSVLLGMSRDAYVVKGTIRVNDGKPRLVEHVWVMTREDGGWVTFWEPSTCEFYHLPNRWIKQKKLDQKEAVVEVQQKEEDEEDDNLQPLERVSYEVQDIRVDVEGDVATDVRGPRPKQRAKAKAAGRDMVRQQMLETQALLPVAPKQQLLADRTLVDWLPYDSVDVAFNTRQLWANRQNHHPACITYNFEDSFPVTEEEGEGAWMTLMSDEERSKHEINYVTQNILMEAPMKPPQVRKMCDQLVALNEETLRLLRGRNGKETNFDLRPQLLQQLDSFLEIHEEVAGLDLDFCPIFEKDRAEWSLEESQLADILAPRFQERCNRLGTAFKQADERGKYRYYSAIQAQEEKGWHHVLVRIKSFHAGKSVFPTMKGKEFSGFPLHFSSADKDLIRDYVMAAPEHLVHVALLWDAASAAGALSLVSQNCPLQSQRG
ncbi:unnamed protein product [Effrenium voratum]|nr:unnamed protein product [Effrenium voratum]